MASPLSRPAHPHTHELTDCPYLRSAGAYPCTQCASSSSTSTSCSRCRPRWRPHCCPRCPSSLPPSLPSSLPSRCHQCCRPRCRPRCGPRCGPRCYPRSSSLLSSLFLAAVLTYLALVHALAPHLLAGASVCQRVRSSACQRVRSSACRRVRVLALARQQVSRVRSWSCVRHHTCDSRCDRRAWPQRGAAVVSCERRRSQHAQRQHAQHDEL